MSRLHLLVVSLTFLVFGPLFVFRDIIFDVYEEHQQEFLLWFSRGLLTVIFGGSAVVLSQIFVWLWYWWYRDQIAWLRQQGIWRNMPESVREGSPFVTAKTPDFVVGIYGILGTRKVLVATGWRYKQYILTAGHAISDLSFDEFVISYRGVYLKVDRWYEVGADLAACRYQDSWMIPSAKIDTVNKPTHVQVFSALSQDNTSMGILKHVPTVAMGFCEYSGSTRAAFSGSPYTNGRQVLGMHLGGGSVANYGYSASYIDMALKRWRRPESSDLEMIRRVLRSARATDVEWDRQLDETYVRIGGRYLVVDNEEFDQLMDDEEYERFFYELEEDGDRMKKTRRNKRWTERAEEPEYDPESERIETDSFLEQRPLRVSPSRGSEEASAPEPITIDQIHGMRDWMAEISRGLAEVSEKFGNLSTSVHNSAQSQLSDLSLRLETNLTTRLDASLGQIRSDLEHRFSQEMKVLKDTLGTSCASSTPPVPQGSDSSKDTQPSAMHWAGMEEDFQTFKQWTASKDPLRPDYVRLRQEFFDQKKWTPEQCKALVARLKNQKNRTKLKLRRVPNGATQSSSS